MTVYTDGVHLVADSLPELHRFAKQLGLRREWFQNHERHPHYDLTTARMVNKAMHYGAQKVSSKTIIRVCRTMTVNSQSLGF